MELFLTRNDPLNTTLVSAKGVAQYQVRTPREPSSVRTSKSLILREALGTRSESIVGEITWGGVERKAVVRSGLFKPHPNDAVSDDGKIRVKDLLWNDHQFVNSKSFVGDDGDEYKWKYSNSGGLALFHVPTGTSKAVYKPCPALVTDGFFKNELKTCLKIHPSCTMDIEIVVLTFIIVEKKRRDKLGKEANLHTVHGGDPVESGMDGGTYTETASVFLRPRPLARSPSSFLLLPLLPKRAPLKELPSEVWSKVLAYVVHNEDDDKLEGEHKRTQLRARWNILLVCKTWRDVALPLLYFNVTIFTASALQAFVAHLNTSDQRWDSIRRIPYSTPGRWVQGLDVSAIAPTSAAGTNDVDALLTRLFPLLPFLTRLLLMPQLLLSNRALHSLRSKDGIERLKALRGLLRPVPKDLESAMEPDDPLLELLRASSSLEQFEVVSPDNVPPDLPREAQPAGGDEDRPALPVVLPLRLPSLKFIALLAVPVSPLFTTLLRTPLPALRHAMVTPYDDSPTSSFTSFLAVHGAGLSTLHVNTPKHWPTVDHPPAWPLLQASPELKHLVVDYPLPTLVVPPGTTHPLQALTIPRPNQRFLRELEALLPRLPKLAVVRAKNVRWLRRGVSGKALEAGVQGEMRDWRRRLGRKGVRLVDGDWLDPE
ncbi:hypothetical protein FA95DRAFT_1599491 [Auriscalpium vulgare]|uniref:Uncharacterized protein n=1 Tax=Auriscalpium vulgare TaxID=40419 RepID=A0ACB8R8R1_9AGAM|nr:hypothetical protein FA95DRAFT_1599491 [Auriscalpium vulgare]